MAPSGLVVPIKVDSKTGLQTQELSHVILGCENSYAIRTQQSTLHERSHFIGFEWPSL